MTELAEPVLIGMFEELVNEEDKCKHEDKPPKWESRINKCGTNQDCDADRLYKNMEKKCDDRGFRGGQEPFVKKAGANYSWDMSKCKDDHFPLQAHHIIPKNHLPTHGVCAFLAKNYTENPNYKLKADTYYDTDHAYNGYCLPYATPLREWDKAKTPDAKDQVAFRLMDKTNRQLHQGSHKAHQYAPEPEQAEEKADIHDEDAGYLGKVDELLDVVHSGAEIHVNSCRVCKEKANEKEINPRESVVRHVDQVSGLIKLLMDSNQIFVSKRAYQHFNAAKKELMEAPDWLASE
jgi:hypothetical protein